jgi:hypothetical protein
MSSTMLAPSTLSQPVRTTVVSEANFAARERGGRLLK